MSALLACMYVRHESDRCLWCRRECRIRWHLSYRWCEPPHGRWTKVTLVRSSYIKDGTSSSKIEAHSQHRRSLACSLIGPLVSCCRHFSQDAASWSVTRLGLQSTHKPKTFVSVEVEVVDLRPRGSILKAMLLSIMHGASCLFLCPSSAVSVLLRDPSGTFVKSPMSKASLEIRFLLLDVSATIESAFYPNGKGSHHFQGQQFNPDHILTSVAPTTWVIRLFYRLCDNTIPELPLWHRSP